jgi:hypothetical protein
MMITQEDVEETQEPGPPMTTVVKVSVVIRRMLNASLGDIRNLLGDVSELRTKIGHAWEEVKLFREELKKIHQSFDEVNETLSLL